MKKLFGAVISMAIVLSVMIGISFAESTYWEKWQKTISLDIFPECGVNVRGAGGDDILQATVDTYCGIKPGGYVGYVNPKVMDIYKKRGKNYPDGKTAVLVFKKIGVAFTTDHKDGKPIYDVISIADGKSIASREPGHPLNPDTCAKCHAGFKGVCRGYVCGNRY